MPLPLPKALTLPNALPQPTDGADADDRNILPTKSRNGPPVGTFAPTLQKNEP